ncbi:MAG: IclR family transcriptional regulator [Desulfuromonadales bacterium]|nr:IclR family transcriptional regulator [Desulfuromonadales bacterium]
MPKTDRSVLPIAVKSFNWVPTPARPELNSQSKSTSIQVVENALTVLETICESTGEVGVSELSESLGMNKSSVWRLLATFTRRGYLEREEKSGRYRLGLSAYAMGIKFRLRMDLLNKAKPIMNRLARDCNEAIYLAVPVRKRFILLEMVDTTQAVRTIPLIGNAYQVGETAVGKVIQAYTLLVNHPEEEEELASIRKQGVGIDSGGFGEGTACIATPLFDGQHKLCGCLSTIGPGFRFSPERIELEFVPLLREASRIVSSQLGYMGHLSDHNL